MTFLGFEGMDINRCVADRLKTKSCLSERARGVWRVGYWHTDKTIHSAFLSMAFQFSCHTTMAWIQNHYSMFCMRGMYEYFWHKIYIHFVVKTTSLFKMSRPNCHCWNSAMKPAFTTHANYIFPLKDKCDQIFG